MVRAACASYTNNSLGDIELSDIAQQRGELGSVVAGRECCLDRLARLAVGQHVLIYQECSLSLAQATLTFDFETCHTLNTYTLDHHGDSGALGLELLGKSGRAKETLFCTSKQCKVYEW